MGNSLTYAKEIYYHFRDNNGNSKVVPVRGVYVANEYKAPEYIEPVLRLLEVNANHSTIVDYIETTITSTSPTSHHLYDLTFDSSLIVVPYTQGRMDTQTASTSHHLYDLTFDPTFTVYEFTQQHLPDQISPTSHHLYDLIYDGTFIMLNHPSSINGSQPEPLLRLIEINVTTSTIEDVT